jgi:serine/threonine protein kinase/ABC-type branched-subunit amino acid transport system substrate-binding protein
MTASVVGSQLSKYQILSEIGRGGMGVVYQAYDPLLDRKVAIKVLAPHLVWEKGFVERFLREARAAARLKHPSIVTIYDVGQDGDRFFFVMEYLEGSTLGDHLRQSGPLPPQQLLAILYPLSDALDYAHSQGLVHRDIKPGNVIVGPAGQVALTDFGIAKAAQETSLTVTGTIMGTPEYMSPEQAFGKEIDHRTDLYSLAVLGYEMLCGQAPFSGTTPHAVVYKQIHEPPPPISQMRPELPAAAEEVVARALAKDPDDRYPTANAFVGALDRALTARQPDTLSKPPARSGTPREPRREPAPAARRAPSGQPDSQSTDQPAAAASHREEPPTQMSQEGKAHPALDAEARPATPVPGRPAAQRPDRTRRRIPPIFWVLGGVAVILIVGGLAWLGLGGIGEATPTAVAVASQHATPTPVSTARPPATATPRPTVPRPTEPAAPPEPECRDPAGCVLIGPGEPVLIAYILFQGADGSGIGGSTVAVEMAMEDRRQILDHPIELVRAHSQCNPDAAHAVAMELAALPNILAVIGPSCSSEARVAAPLLCEASIPLVSPSSTAPELTAEDRPPEFSCFFTTVGADSAVPTAAARFAISRDLRRAATLHSGTASSEMLEHVFAVAFEEMGGIITTREALVPDGPEADQLLRRIAESEPQLLFYPVQAEAAVHITHIAREIPELRGVLLVGSHGTFSPGFLGAGGEAAIGVLTAATDVTEAAPGLREFVFRLEERQGGSWQSPFPLFAYDAANMVFSAIETVAARDDAGRLQIGRAALVEALYATRGFQGLSGRLTCHRLGDCSNSSIAMYEIVNPDPDSWNPGDGLEHNPRKIWP